MENTTAIRQPNGQIRPFARCKRSATKPAKKRTGRINRNGFLSYRFLPFWEYSNNKTRAEREFYNSLSNLCKYYDLLQPQLMGAFPQSIYQTLQAVIGSLKSVDDTLSCIIAQDEKHIATLATIKRLDTGMMLYYIPVRPLWNWMQDESCQRMSELVTCIFAYLEQVVKIPFYTEQDSYLASQYDTLEQWVSDEQEDELYRQKQIDEFYTMQNAGLKIYAQISNPENLNKFVSAIANFNPQEKWEEEWHSVATLFLELFKQYPERYVFDHIQSDLLYPNDEDRIYADQYISFYWSGNDCFQDSLFDMIDNHFQEIAYMEEPAYVQLFDNLPNSTIEDFDFENRMFDLIDKLSRLLNKYDHEQCEPPVQ